MDTSMRAILTLRRCSMAYTPRRKLTREFKLEAVRQTALSEKPKAELVMHCDYKTRDDARVSLFDYMEVFYNRQRRHSSISYEAPLPFEAMQSPGKVSTVRG